MRVYYGHGDRLLAEIGKWIIKSVYFQFGSNSEQAVERKSVRFYSASGRKATNKHDLV